MAHPHQTQRLEDATHLFLQLEELDYRDAGPNQDARTEISNDIRAKWFIGKYLNVIAGLDSLGYIELLPKVHNYDAAKDTLLI